MIKAFFNYRMAIIAAILASAATLVFASDTKYKVETRIRDTAECQQTGGGGGGTNDCYYSVCVVDTEGCADCPDGIPIE